MKKQLRDAFIVPWRGEVDLREPKAKRRKPRKGLDDKHHVLLIPHVENCGAIKNVRSGGWSTPWSCPELKFLERDSTGRTNHRTSRMYLVYGCNTIDCPAKIAVDANWADIRLGLTTTAKYLGAKGRT